MRHLFNVFFVALTLGFLLFLQACSDETITGESVKQELSNTETDNHKESVSNKSINDDAFLLFHRGTSNQYIYAMGLDQGSLWRGYRLPDNIRSTTTPEAVLFKDKVFLFWRGEANTNSDIYFSSNTKAGASWPGSGWAAPQVAIEDSEAFWSVSAVVFDDKLWLFYEANDNIFYTWSHDGENWPRHHMSRIERYRRGTSSIFNNGTADLGRVNHDKFALGVLGNRLYCFWVDFNNSIRYISAKKVISPEPSQILEWQVPNGVTQMPFTGRSTDSGMDLIVLSPTKMYLAHNTYQSGTAVTQRSSFYLEDAADGRLRTGSAFTYPNSDGSPSDLGYVYNGVTSLLGRALSSEGNDVKVFLRSIVNQTDYNQSIFTHHLDATANTGVTMVSLGN